jgi:pimeloyl-ACP methyl ester carboxylesterase
MAKDYHTHRLADGRQLAFNEYGVANGQPVFFFHGGNDSRLEAVLLEAAASDLGLRLVAPDRPGYGRSDPQSGRRLLDWPQDVAQLATGLGIASFAVVGHSGGGPHAAAVATRYRSGFRASRWSVVPPHPPVPTAACIQCSGW